MQEKRIFRYKDNLIQPSMTFEVKFHLMKKLGLYKIGIIHTK